MDALTNQSTASSTDPPDASSQSLSVNDAEAGENSLENLSPEKPPALSQNEDEDDEEESEQERATSVNNRFNTLSEDQASEDVSVEGEKVEDVNASEEDDGAEEDRLTEELHTLSLKTESEMENGDVKEYTVVNQDPELAFQSLASRTGLEKQECSVESCLYQFTEVEHLSENNRLMCVTCTKQQSGHKASDGTVLYFNHINSYFTSRLLYKPLSQPNLGFTNMLSAEPLRHKTFTK